MLELTATQTAAGIEYVADHENIRVDGTALRTVTSPAEAAAAIAAETTDRLRTVFAARPGQPIVLLSGGVDSIYVAATATALGHRPHAVTIVTGEDTDDHGPASAAAAALGLTHDVITLEPDDVVRLARTAARTLGTSELWEIAAAMPLLAAKETIASHLAAQSEPAAVLSGGGADTILAGGCTLSAPIDSPDAVAEVDTLVRDEVANNFVRERYIPDFHERLLDEHVEALIHVFQTDRFWQLAKHLAPSALFRNVDGVVRDKIPVRIACEQALPEDVGALAWSRKSPIQRSTGLFAALADAARAAAAALPGATTYTNPLTEPIESVAIRLYLNDLCNS